MPKKISLIPPEAIEKMILVIRDKKVMPDPDLGEIYGVRIIDPLIG